MFIVSNVMLDVASDSFMVGQTDMYFIVPSYCLFFCELLGWKQLFVDCVHIFLVNASSVRVLSM